MLEFNNAFILISSSAYNTVIRYRDIICSNSCKIARFSVKLPSMDLVESLGITKECTSIVAIGGGTIMDTAKLAGWKYNLPVICIPTIPGTGAEATGFAVSYKSDGNKESIITPVPSCILIPDLAMRVPKSTLLISYFDALAQCIETLWNVNSTDESRNYASMGIEEMIKAYNYFHVEPVYSGLRHAYRGAHYSGKAINISKTTAPHAMSYYLTKKYSVSHGAAVAMSFKFWYKKCKRFISSKFYSLLPSMEELDKLIDEIVPKTIYGEIDFYEWAYSVNAERMKNSPVVYDDPDILAKELSEFYTKA